MPFPDLEPDGTLRARNGDAGLEVTREQLARLKQALADLSRERGRYGEAWFAVMAEGPLDEIARLEVELATLTGRAVLEVP